ncbi:MAG: hypothetical protein RR367_12195 [Clostridia bacterium]
MHILLSKFCKLTPGEIGQVIKDGERHKLQDAIKLLSEKLGKRIALHSLTLPPVHEFSARDRSSGKLRDYCEEAVIQQICNYIAVEALMPLFQAKIGAHQCASLVNRGQRYGKMHIERWMRRDPKGTRNAIQADVRKAYPSTDKRRLKRMLKRDVKNDDLLWLVFLLLDKMPKGLSIGSYLSMYLCNYMLSYAWRFAKQRICHAEWRKHRRTGIYERHSIPLIRKVMLYMDDILAYGANKRDLLKGFGELCRFMRKKLGYRIKRSWRHFRTHFTDKAGRQRGSFTDIMGVRIYRDHSTLRRRIFLRTRKTYAKMERRTRGCRPISKRLAGRVVAYHGWLVHSDSRQWMKRHAYKHGLITRAKRTIAFYAKKARENHDSEGRILPSACTC